MVQTMYTTEDMIRIISFSTKYPDSVYIKSLLRFILDVLELIVAANTAEIQNATSTK